MAATESATPASSALVPKFASLLAVVGSFALLEWVTSYHLLSNAVPLPPSLGLGVTWLVEHQVWQFGIGMTAITVLSRGHLWSFGINSSDIRISMSVLLKFYAVAILVIAGVVGIPLLLNGEVPSYCIGITRADMVVWILLEWMAAAVGNEIYFHGFFQTLLLKYWKEKLFIGSFEIPFVVLFTSVAFAVGKSTIPVYGGQWVEYLLALLIGFYGGMVYYRTRSLLTPMLSQAFFYGFPFVIRFAYLALKRL